MIARRHSPCSRHDEAKVAAEEAGEALRRVAEKGMEVRRSTDRLKRMNATNHFVEDWTAVLHRVVGS